MLFKQLRTGYLNIPFYVYKIRTMDENKNVSKIGRFLRMRGLDELPQLINVLKGEMALVGPRPLIPWEHDKFRGFPLPVKPGLTGWWQIHGRVQEDIKKYDLEYIKRKSFWFDLYILWKTIPLVLLRRHG